MPKAIEVKDGIYYVGHKDWIVRNFHGYTTSRGSSYNAYLIRDEKNVLVDTVKAPYAEELIENVSRIIDPSKIDFVLSNHTEPDHSGSMPAVMEAMPNATVIATAAGEKGLKKYYGGDDWKFQVVKNGDSMSIGKRSLVFVPTPMVHWPDSLATYVPEEKLIFTMDAFGQHFATSSYYDDEVDYSELMLEAKKYYANIVMHLGNVIKKVLPAVEALDIDMMAPSHGLIWRKHIPDIIARYKAWTECKPSAKVLVIYDSMWHSTEMMAHAIYDGANKTGINVRLIDLKSNDLTDIVTDVLDAGAVIVGSPTLNNGMMPTVSAFLTYMKGLKPTNKIGFAFGSHGWAGGGAKAVNEELVKTGIEIVRDPLTCVFRPEQQVLDECIQLGSGIADRVAAL
ncbi:MAG TPA: FprA family A-type flavoprotein [bacterium]|nr:FprA family A-type flavoprotein [bacterium]